MNITGLKLTQYGYFVVALAVERQVPISLST